MTSTVGDRVVAGVGEAFRDRAGDLLPALVDGLTVAIETTAAQVVPGDGARWSPVYDLNTTTEPKWLGQVAGTRVPDGLSLDEARQFVRDRAGFKRGTPGAIRAAVAALLTGAKRVDLTERDGSPWRVRVTVFAGQIPGGVSPSDLLAAVDAERPVGIIASLEIRTGASFAHMKNRHGPTFAAEAAAFPTFADAIAHQPEPGTEI